MPIMFRSAQVPPKGIYPLHQHAWGEFVYSFSGVMEVKVADNRSLPELAHAAHTTERTLMRRCQRDLGMSLTEWRQRLRVVKAMPLLQAGQTVETIALDLGYGSASAFIAMFKKRIGTTPDEFRKGN